MTANHPCTRRRFLQHAALAAAGTALSPMLKAATEASAAPYTLAMQGYCLGELNLPALLQAIDDWPINTLELYDRQLSVFLSKADRQHVQQQLNQANVQVPATYTEHFSRDAARNRKILNFGQAMGLKFFSCRPDEPTMAALNDMVQDFSTDIALHNTSPGGDASLVSLDEVEATLQRHDNLNACVDIGNFARTRIDPIKALRRLDGRILEVHLKDIDRQGRSVPFGEGELDLPGILSYLRQAQFDGLVTIEYTGNPDDLAQRKTNLQQAIRRSREWSS
jgi:sugar phosphate isomerase/epimerase